LGKILTLLRVLNLGFAATFRPELTLMGILSVSFFLSSVLFATHADISQLRLVNDHCHPKSVAFPHPPRKEAK
jgi:hypothetical protein